MGIKLLVSILRYYLRLKVLFVLLFCACQARGNDQMDGRKGGRFNVVEEAQLLLAAADSNMQSSPMLALEYSVKAEVLARRASDNQLLSLALMKKGMASYYVGNLGGAAESLIGCKNLLSNEGGDKEMLGRVYNDLAAVYRYSGFQPDSALVYYKRAIDAFREAAETEEYSVLYAKELAAIYSNMGQMYVEEEAYEQAIFYLDRSLTALSQKKGYDRVRAATKISLVDVWSSMGKTLGADSLLSEVLSATRAEEDWVLYSAALFYKGKLQERVNELDSAYLFYERALAEAQSAEVWTSVDKIALALSDLACRMNRQEDAYEYLQLVQHAKEKMRRGEAALALSKMELEAKYKKWEEEVTSQMDRSRVSYLIVLGLAFLGGLILLSLYIAIVRKQRLAQLEYLESELVKRQLETERERLATEVEDTKQKLALNLLERMSANEMVNETLQKLMEVYRQVPTVSSRKSLQAISNSLRNIQDHSLWEEFELLYKHSNSDFFEALAGLGLTSNERRLCVFLRMNMATKEISALTGQSTKAVEVARTRLRRKLGLTNTEVDLSEYLMLLVEESA